MPSIPPIIFVIPTWNNADSLDATIRSVREQDCDPAKLFFCFVDFGSTDGTVEKIMEMPREHTGFFSLPGRPRGRTALARATRMCLLQNIGGRKIVLWPGDMLSPNCISTLEFHWDRAARENLKVGCMLAEVEVLQDDGSVYAPPPLLNGPALLRGFSSDTLHYVNKGWRRQILRYGPECFDIDKVGAYNSHVRHWNQMGYAGIFCNTIYLPDKLARQRRYEPPDELDDLLFRFETGLTCFRMASEQPETHVTGPYFEEAFRANLSKYALWRAWLVRRRGNAKTAEDCFLMARVINPAVAPNSEFVEAWRRMERWLAHGDEADAAWLEAWFSREEPPVPPKLPFGGMVRRWQRQWKLWRTKDRQTEFGS